MRTMILIDVELEYAREDRLVLRDNYPDDGYTVVAMAGPQVAREYYRRLVERGEGSGSITVTSVDGFTDLMLIGYVATTTPSGRSGRLWEEFSEAVLPQLHVRIQGGRKLPRLLTGCELTILRPDWLGASPIWKDRISRTTVLLA
jgi:hypothetical protein